MIIIFLKEKDERVNYFLKAQLGRDGRNETESRPTVLAAVLKLSGIDLHVIKKYKESKKVAWT